MKPTQNRDVVIGKLNLVSFSFVLDTFPAQIDPRCPLDKESLV